MSDIQAVNDHRNDDEIDLVQLMKTLLLGKKIIISSTVLFTAIAIVYVLIAQQWWTSSAIITTGKYSNIAPLYQQVTNFYVVANNQNKNNELDNLLDKKSLLSQYIIDFNSFDNKKDFILSNPIMKEYYANVVNRKGDIHFVDNWSEKIKATLMNNLTPEIYTLSFQATTSDLSHQLLLAYIQFINHKVHQDIFTEIGSLIKSNEFIFKSQLLSLKAQAEQLKQQELMKTEYALDISNSAKANKPMPQMNSNQLFPIDIGSEGLAEKIKILKEIKDSSLFEPAITKVRSDFDLLSAIKLDKNINFETIHYLQNVKYPTNKDKPKRILIVIFGLLFGFIIGMLIVIFKYINKKKK
ncbi:LPS O-antigen chain length determinant protein WzzB [Photobacterium phosphoreum]|uniref:LPS O-antigen chain length determinant protein WzzB n=1 Tax=Photobacterium phosphoreum TaxID=659 RepID=UPI001E2FADAD|nr:Wzz/FepE/Etk N-terminal domain-containing protein [Photobacterium phosphoreum]